MKLSCGVILMAGLLCLGAAPLVAENAKKLNVLLICIDDLRPELACFGKMYIHSPNIDKLASQGTIFSRHYVQAPTCGASRYALLTGHYGPEDNEAIFQRANALGKGEDLPVSMPAWFRQKGYTTVSIGKVSHHPGGRGGNNWDDDAQKEMPNSWSRHLNPNGDWQNPKGTMHGLAHGEVRGKADAMAVYQSAEGEDTIYPDGLVTETALEQLSVLSSESSKPFFLAVGFVKPHLPLGAPAKYMEYYKDMKLPKINHPEKPDWVSTWHASSEFMKYNRWGRDPNTDSDFAELVRKHYAACVSYADAQVGRILAQLEAKGLKQNTIVVLWGDHGWHLGERGIWGKHALFEESLLSPLIVTYPGQVELGKSSEAVVETIDIFPTLCNLTGLDMPADLHGESLLPLLENPKASGHVAIAYKKSAKTIRDQRYRLVVHDKGEVELYDFENGQLGTENVASSHPEVVERLSNQLINRIAQHPQDKY